MSALIHYRCTAAEHQRPSTADLGTPTSPITYHDGKWAYCPLGFHDGHTWTGIAPSSLDQVKQALRSEVRLLETST